MRNSWKDNMKELIGQSLSSMLRLTYDWNRWATMTALASVRVPQWRHWLLPVDSKMQSNSAQKCTEQVQPAKSRIIRPQFDTRSPLMTYRMSAIFQVDSSSVLLGPAKRWPSCSQWFVHFFFRKRTSRWSRQTSRHWAPHRRGFRIYHIVSPPESGVF